MNAAIFLTGLSGIDKPKPVENFYFDSLDEVKEQLKQLQKGYCEGKEKPKVRPREYNRPGKSPVKALEATSDCDYSYVAYLGMVIKTLPIPPGKIISANSLPELLDKINEDIEKRKGQ